MKPTRSSLYNGQFFAPLRAPSSHITHHYPTISLPQPSHAKGVTRQIHRSHWSWSFINHQFIPCLFAGSWFAIFLFVWKLIIPTNFHMFQRGGSTTNQWYMEVSICFVPSKPCKWIILFHLNHPNHPNHYGKSQSNMIRIDDYGNIPFPMILLVSFASHESGLSVEKKAWDQRIGGRWHLPGDPP